MAKSNRPRVAIVGATGLVGQTFIKVLEEREFPMESLTLMASARSVGKRLAAFGEEHEVIEATPDAFEGYRYCPLLSRRRHKQTTSARSRQTWSHSG